ncbi:hypothetical protein T05_13324 [Trichinella murrelli]|uniref:Transmembrane protein n=1 Tax=Trichinella murrelli TaxID=144512 RepID=A0A0V0TS24_9BILA|nr:hypothetical protein T05_13324 [Trichinella murrelli]
MANLLLEQSNFAILPLRRCHVFFVAVVVGVVAAAFFAVQNVTRTSTLPPLAHPGTKKRSFIPIVISGEEVLAVSLAGSSCSSGSSGYGAVVSHQVTESLGIFDFLLCLTAGCGRLSLYCLFSWSTAAVESTNFGETDRERSFSTPSPVCKFLSVASDRGLPTLNRLTTDFPGTSCSSIVGNLCSCCMHILQ